MSLVINMLRIGLISLVFSVAMLLFSDFAFSYDSIYYHPRPYVNYYTGPLLYGDGYGNTYIYDRGRRYPTRLRGLNDHLYQVDNVYGFGASAAGRMSRTVRNVPIGPYNSPY